MLEELLEDPTYDRVIAAVRRPIAQRHPKLVTVTVDFHRIVDFHRELAAHDVYCCLGTTLKSAGSKEAFRRVDFDYCVGLAHLARTVGSRAFVLVSSAGASKRSALFYSRVKGEVEEAVARLGLRRYFVVRPSILDGERIERRAGERVGLALAKAFAPMMVGRTAKYRPIEAGAVARAMVALTKSGRPSGIVESTDLARLAGARR